MRKITLKYPLTSYHVLGDLPSFYISVKTGLKKATHKHFSLKVARYLAIHFSQNNQRIHIKCIQRHPSIIKNIQRMRPFYQNIREEYIPKFILLNPEISTILDNEKQVILSILDPVSSKLPLTVKNGWTSVKAAYDVSRKFCYDIHRKRDKFYTNLDKDNK